MSYLSWISDAGFKNVDVPRALNFAKSWALGSKFPVIISIFMIATIYGEAQKLRREEQRLGIPKQIDHWSSCSQCFSFFFF